MMSQGLGTGRTPGVLVCLGALLGGGCAPRAALTLVQADAPPGQQRLELASDWCFTSQTPDGRRALLAFPLPGAEDGPRDFLVYIQSPPHDGPHAVDPGRADGARGFFIQLVGQRAGKTEFQSGSVRYRHPPLRTGSGVLELDVRCTDGSHLTGRARLMTEPTELRRFERRYAADIARLTAPTSQPVATLQPAASELLTPPRPGGSDESVPAARTP